MIRPDRDEFDASTENPLLKEAIRQRIQEAGRITFHEFMQMALYHPRHGYYASEREPMGRHGDYLTSPQVHPIFGYLVAKQLWQMWEVMGRPHPFEVVEMGPGTGLLARDILRWAQSREPDFFGTLRYYLVEPNEALAARQRTTLAELSLPARQASWEEPEADSVTGCFLSNELVDSFAVHRLAVEGGELREVYVTWAEGSFREETGPPSTPALAAYFDRLGLQPGEGCRAEVNLQAVEWMADMGRTLRQGFALTFDYGYPAPELYAPWRRDGTLLCFYRHNPSTDPYARLGRQDITAHVDFTTLMRAGEEHGLEPLGLTTQARFLAALGIGAGLETVARESPQALEEYYARRRAVSELIDPAGLGRIRVLIQARGLGPCELWGLAG